MDPGEQVLSFDGHYVLFRWVEGYLDSRRSDDAHGIGRSVGQNPNLQHQNGIVDVEEEDFHCCVVRHGVKMDFT